jgi:NitT/TauT family transport system ATP-binding protein
MKQRVGIARALASDPDILLMDEPFGALDILTREMMQKELLRIWLELKLSVLFITHSISEAVYLADRILVMKNGHVAETFQVTMDRPRDISHPDYAELVHSIQKLLTDAHHL